MTTKYIAKAQSLEYTRSVWWFCLKSNYLGCTYGWIAS